MSEALQKYNEIFKSSFGVEDSQLQELEYKVYPEWNSMAHIGLISALEEAFDINFDADDIFALTTYEDGKELLKNRFDITL